MDREKFIDSCLEFFNDETLSFGESLKSVVTSAMEYVGGKDWSGTNKKTEVLEIIGLVLEKTDSPGPDFVVDKAVMWGCEWAIDAIYEAFKGKFKLDG